jgi:hypothetical protein
LNKRLLGAAALALYALHQDVFLFRRAEPLLFGFLPPGLWYHAAYMLAVAALLAAFVRWAWPAHLDPEEPPQGERR